MTFDEEYADDAPKLLLLQNERFVQSNFCFLKKLSKITFWCQKMKRGESSVESFETRFGKV